MKPVRVFVGPGASVLAVSQGWWDRAAAGEIIGVVMFTMTAGSTFVDPITTTSPPVGSNYMFSSWLEGQYMCTDFLA